MQRNELNTVRHTQIAELMQSLASMQFKMSRVKSMFPNYYQQLQQTYNQMLMQARKDNLLPPWMTA